MGITWDDCGGKRRWRWIVHTRPVHAVMAVHTVYQSNAYRIDFNICVGSRERGRGDEENRRRERERKRDRENRKERIERKECGGEEEAFTRHLGTCGCDS